MIDFQGSNTVFKLKKVNKAPDNLNDLLINGESVIGC